MEGALPDDLPVKAVSGDVTQTCHTGLKSARLPGVTDTDCSWSTHVRCRYVTGKKKGF